jgi:hypothetical protein
MVTGRPHFHTELTNAIVTEPALLLDISANADDVRTYLSSRLESQRYLSPALKLEIVKLISQEADGM